MGNGLVAAEVTSRKLIGFPNPVNEKAARTVAGGVLLLSCLTLALSVTVGDVWLWLTVPISLGFIAVVLTITVLLSLRTAKRQELERDQPEAAL